MKTTRRITVNLNRKDVERMEYLRKNIEETQSVITRLALTFFYDHMKENRNKVWKDPMGPLILDYTISK